MDWWRSDWRNHFRTSVVTVLEQNPGLELTDSNGGAGILPDPVFPDKLSRSFVVYVQKTQQPPPKKFWLSHMTVECSLADDPHAVQTAFAKWLAENFPE